MAECVDLVDRADANDRTLMVAQMQRFDPAHVALKERIDDGELGRVHQARADGLQNLRRFVDEGHWLFDGERAGGGGIISVLIHKLDLLRYFVGDVRRVHALGKTVDPAFENAEDHCVGLLEFENGAIGTLFSTYSAAGFSHGESFHLFGERGVAYHDSTDHEGGGVPRIRSERTGDDP